MSESPQHSDPLDLIAALRSRGAVRVDPVRFHYLETLSKRAQDHQGTVRRVLDARLAQHVAELQSRLEDARLTPDSAIADQQRASYRTPLGELVAYLAQQQTPPQMENEGAVEMPDTSGAPGEDLKSLRYFRDTWAKLSVEQTVSQALASGPENAGPLNSHLLVLQSLALMRDAAPDYLNRFMTYADTLLWLDQVQSNLAQAKKDQGRNEGNKKRKPPRTKAASS